MQQSDLTVVTSTLSFDDIIKRTPAIITDLYTWVRDNFDNKKEDNKKEDNNRVLDITLMKNYGLEYIQVELFINKQQVININNINTFIKEQAAGGKNIKDFLMHTKELKDALTALDIQSIKDIKSIKEKHGTLPWFDKKMIKFLEKVKSENNKQVQKGNPEYQKNSLLNATAWNLFKISPKAFKSIYIDKGKTTTPSFLAKLFNTKKCQAIEASNKQEGNIVSNSKEKETVASEEHPKIEKIAHIIQSLIPFGYLCNLIKNLPKDTVRASVDKRHQGEKTRALTNNIK